MAKSKLARIIFWAFILNTSWEFGQCIYFYDMWSWSFWKSTIWMWMAIFGDILIVLELWKRINKTFFICLFSNLFNKPHDQ